MQKHTVRYGRIQTMHFLPHPSRAKNDDYELHKAIKCIVCGQLRNSHRYRNSCNDRSASTGFSFGLLPICTWHLAMLICWFVAWDRPDCRAASAGLGEGLNTYLSTAATSTTSHSDAWNTANRSITHPEDAVFDNCLLVRCGDENIKIIFWCKIKKQGENHELITSSDAFIN